MTATTPFDPLVELFLNNGWRDISALGDVRYQGSRGIRITNGLQDEASQINSTCTLTLDNRSGAYSPRNPMGPWFGYLKRNTPIRVSTRPVRDFFTARTAVNGWGTSSQSPGFLGWTTTGGSAGDYAVTGGVATHSLSSTATRTSYLADVGLSHVELRGTFQLPFADTLGGNVLLTLGFRGISTSNVYRAQVAVTAAEAVTVQFTDYFGVLVGSPTTVPGLTHSGQKIRVAAHLDGEKFRIKVWAATSVEPYAWNLEADSYTVTPGWVSIESAKAAGNTNGTFSVSWTDVEVINRRFIGEVSEWPPQRDISGKDTTTTITAAGILRRLRAGNKPLRSPAYRSLSRAAGLIAYWPCEDGSSAAQLASLRSDWPQMNILTTAKPSFAASTKFFASQPVPVVGTSIWDGQVAPYAVPSPGVIQMRWLMYVDTSSGEPADGASLVRWYCEGSAAYWIVRYKTGGGLQLQCLDTNQTQLFVQAVGFTVNNARARVNLNVSQNGANIDWNLGVANIGAPVAGFFTGTLNAQTVGMLRSITVGTDQNLNNVSIGHITAQSAITSFFDFANEMNAWQGEAGLTRISRICSEQGIPFQGEGATSMAMGPQPVAAPLDFLAQTAQCDQGLTFEPRSHSCLGYMTSQSLTNRPVRLTLDYSAHNFFDSLPVIDDDRYTVNQVTVTKSNSDTLTGSSVTVSQDSGYLAALPFEQGGVGVYDKAYQINCDTYLQTADLAGWLLMKGALDQPRIPQVTMYLHNQRIYADLSTLMGAWDLREGAVLTIANLPTVISADTRRLMVIGSAERLTQFEHEITWNTQPGDAYLVAQLDDSFYRVEAGAAFLNADVVTTGATSISVKSLDGTTFTTDAAEMPFDITVGGERMRVTAVAGTTSPQTFTVTRSINGVVKTHVADNTETARVSVVSHSVLALA